MNRTPEMLAPSSVRRAGSSATELLPLLLIAAGARVVWWVVASKAMSQDLIDWHAVVLQIAKGANPYETTIWMNHPPFWFEVLFIAQRFSARFGASDISLIRAVLLAGDLAVLAAIWQLLRMLRPHVSKHRLLIWGYCLNPLLILLTIQHGNFDALAIFWDILFLQFLIRFRRGGKDVDWFMAAQCLGLAIYTKTFSAILWPLLVPGARGMPWRARILGALLVAAPTVLAIAPLFVLNPQAMTEHVLKYHSVGNSFGLVGALSIGYPQLDLDLYSHIFTILLAAAAIASAIHLWKRDLRSEGDVVLVATLALLSLFTFGPGYGSQYWFWVLPLLLVCHREAEPAYRRLIAIFLIVVICTNVFEYAFEYNLGRFLFCWFPTRAIASVGEYFPYLSVHMILLRMPMSIASLAMIVRGMEGVFRRNAAASLPNHPV